MLKLSRVKWTKAVLIVTVIVFVFILRKRVIMKLRSQKVEKLIYTNILLAVRKMQGHKRFIPADKFTLKHLPERYQDKDLYEYIKIISNQTVRVSVTMTTPHRPDVWPKTTQPYPFHNMSNRRNLRTGSGRVKFINKYIDGFKQNGIIGRTDSALCWCKKCQDSDSPSNVWWEFYVHTATHVVFDDIEASHTTLRLFYDKDDSPVVSVDKVSLVGANIEYDSCVLKSVTCDKTLGEKLTIISEKYVNIWEKITNKYNDPGREYTLNFIVSHPHGCAKQISIGQRKYELHVYGGTKYTYTTSTCPGSSGANVLFVGYNDTWRFDVVHSGSLKSGLNYSGVGVFY
ncbi:uncharacterized protein LOC106074390 isoform X2 [Biomphalaria glabrata]|uniref:Uncharacterized protein LOC106074390 isoform X2 n=1 Tax=Biomphalaria glabrata TaxID=6526 RepID=A0A9W3B209_BIOGL|nr:uncharacterized protein LOC106074390 isoform X2 [Biomphalaria glabrata]